MIEHLRKMCYTMSTARDLLIDITKDYFSKLGGYENIRLHGEDYKIYKEINNLKIQNCLDEFADDEVTAKKILSTYKEVSDPEFQCGCVEVFGLYRFSLKKWVIIYMYL